MKLSNGLKVKCTLCMLVYVVLRGVKDWVRFFRARTEIAYGFRNNHMTSNTSVGSVLASLGTRPSHEEEEGLVNLHT